MMSNINVYRSSAGSGKTYKLTEEYLKIVFKTPKNYKSILAVTFTNKATDEMKSRILNELEQLSKGEKTNYLHTIKTIYGYTNDEVKNKAKEILSNLLHDYSMFSVTTIDSFFQKVIRSFTREVGLNANYDIELNQDKILERTIDLMLDDLENEKELQKWLLLFAEEKIESNKSWNLKQDIIGLGQQIFKEDYSLFTSDSIERLKDKKFIGQYKTTLNKIKHSFENKLQSIGKEALAYIEQIELHIDDFSYGKAGVIGYFVKNAQKKDFTPKRRAIDAMDDVTKWYKKSAPSSIKSSIEKVVGEKLNFLLSESLNFYNQNSEEYFTACEISNFIYTLGILNNISSKILDITHEENIFLLSNSSYFLTKIIDNNDAPFIYEKVGTFYTNILIDEFQDTSGMQWANFKPLVQNCLANGFDNLIVGDVKQSIYRWRNSNWQLLAEQIANDFDDSYLKFNNLQTNWRSTKNIIQFNNTIFREAPNVLQNMFDNSLTNRGVQDFQNKIINTYVNSFQYQPEQISGYSGKVTVLFVEKKNKWKEKIIEKLIYEIEHLQDEGCSLKDMAILVRRKSEGEEIVRSILEYKKNANTRYLYDIISNESLYIKNATFVQFLLHIIAYFNNPKDKITQAYILQQYYLKIGKEEEKTLHSILKFTNKKEKSFTEMMPAFFSSRIDRLKQMPLFELVEELIRIFKLNEFENEIPYLQSFQDTVLQYTQNNTSNINSFLEWWEEEGGKQTINLSEEVNAIKVLTIHKAKGLEFKTVFVPFCNWEIDSNNHKNIIWCKPSQAPFDNLKIVPVRYSQKLKNTIFYKNYFSEKFQSYIDSLNLLYVTLTRAVERLYLWAPINENIKPNTGLKDVGELLYQLMENPKIFNDTDKKNYVNLSEYWNKEKLIFQMGNSHKRDKEKTKKNIPHTITFNRYPSSNLGTLSLKYLSDSIFSVEKEEIGKEMHYGKIMHDIFKNIITIEDIDKAINEVIIQGRINIGEKKKLKDKIKDSLKNDKAKDWFSPKWTVKTETEILIRHGKNKIPDRVIYNDKEAKVIDFKFGYKEDPRHIKQVKEYSEILKKMGFLTVSPYIWYVEQKKIVKLE